MRCGVASASGAVMVEVAYGGRVLRGGFVEL